MYIGFQAIAFDVVPGRDPVSVTAASIYMASQASEEKLIMSEIGKVIGMKEKTILETYKLMHPHAINLFPPDFCLILSMLPTV